MKLELAHILVCPICHATLTIKVKEQRGEQIISGFFTCPGCKRRFEIEDGVPRFLLGRELARTRATFDAQWRLRFAGKFEKKPILYFQAYEELTRWWFSSCLGHVAAGEWMLDAGCGTGEKAMAVARQNPDLQVVAMDMVDTVSISAQRAETIPNLHFVQGDVIHPPFRKNFFAKVVSWGVLHSTRNTEEAFRVIASFVAPGGRLLLWLYPHASEDRLLGRYYRIREKHFLGIGHRLPPRFLLWLVRLYCFIMGPVFLYDYKREVLPRLRSRSYYLRAENVSLRERYKSTVFIVYDMLVPEHVFPQRRAEVIRWYNDNGFTGVETDKLGHYWGERPRLTATSS